jgi:sporulation-control protein spo0M
MFEKITSHLGIYKKILASASILSLLGNSLLYAEVYYPQNGAFIPKKYTMVHGVGTPNQSIDITEK